MALKNNKQQCGISGKRKIFFCSVFLCENNSYYGTIIYDFFKKNNYEIVDKSYKADTIIINTCAVTQYAEEKCKDVINHFIKNFQEKKQIIIYGCLCKINTEYQKVDGTICISPYELHKFNDLFPHDIPIEGIKGNVINKGFSSSQDDVYHVMIAQGCINNCSYCAIKKAKGNLKSKSISIILDEMNAGLRAGYNKFEFIADDCGCYGLDLKTDFGALLDKISEIDDSFSLEIHYIEPSRFLKHFDNIINLAKRKKIDHINIPLQTGSQRILKLMKRAYDILEVADHVKKLRESFKVHISSDIIIGFPTETREEFRETLNISGAFDLVELFLYSPRHGTEASKIQGQLPKEEMSFRDSIARELEKNNPEKYHYKRGDKNNTIRTDSI